MFVGALTMGGCIPSSLFGIIDASLLQLIAGLALIIVGICYAILGLVSGKKKRAEAQAKVNARNNNK